MGWTIKRSSGYDRKISGVVVNEVGLSKKREREVFKRVWPDGMPADQRVIYEAVPPSRRPLVVERLDAAWRALNGEAWEPLAQELGLKRSAFYDLRNGWRDRALSGVIPYDKRAGRRIKTKPKDPLRKKARDLLLAREGGGRNVDVAKRLLRDAEKRTGDLSENARLAALQRMERLVQDERRALAGDLDYLRASYGQRVIVDLSAVNIILEEPRRAFAVAAMVLEDASGLVLGSALGTLDDALATQRHAVRSAIAFVRRHRADVDPAGPLSDVTLTMAPGLRCDEAEGEDLAKAVRNFSVFRNSPYGFGRSIVQAIGPRVGRVVVAPRRTLAIDVEQYLESRLAEVLSKNAAGATWNREVLRHNEAIISGLTKAGLFDGNGPSNGSMAIALKAVSVYLSKARSEEDGIAT